MYMEPDDDRAAVQHHTRELRSTVVVAKALLEKSRATTPKRADAAGGSSISGPSQQQQRPTHATLEHQAAVQEAQELRRVLDSVGDVEQRVSDAVDAALRKLSKSHQEEVTQLKADHAKTTQTLRDNALRLSKDLQQRDERIASLAAQLATYAGDKATEGSPRRAQKLQDQVGFLTAELLKRETLLDEKSSAITKLQVASDKLEAQVAAVSSEALRAAERAEAAERTLARRVDEFNHQMAAARREIARLEQELGQAELLELSWRRSLELETTEHQEKQTAMQQQISELKELVAKLEAASQAKEEESVKRVHQHEHQLLRVKNTGLSSISSAAYRCLCTRAFLHWQLFAVQRITKQRECYFEQRTSIAQFEMLSDEQDHMYQSAQNDARLNLYQAAHTEVVQLAAEQMESLRCLQDAYAQLEAESRLNGERLSLQLLDKQSHTDHLVAAHSSEVAALRESLARESEEVVSLKHDVVRLTSSLQSMTDEACAARDALQQKYTEEQITSKQRALDLELQLDHRDKQLAECQTDLLQARSCIEERNARVEELLLTEGSLRQELEGSVALVAHMQSLAATKANHDEQLLEQHNKKIQHLESDIQSLREEKNKQTNRCSELENELLSQAALVKKWELKCRDLERTQGDLRHELEHAQQQTERARASLTSQIEILHLMRIDSARRTPMMQSVTSQKGIPCNDGQSAAASTVEKKVDTSAAEPIEKEPVVTVSEFIDVTDAIPEQHDAAVSDGANICDILPTDDNEDERIDEAALLQATVDSLTEQLSFVNEENASLKQSLERARATADDHHMMVRSMTATLHEKEEALAALQQANETLKSNFEASVVESALYKQRLVHSSEEVSDMREKLNGASQMNTELSSRLVVLEKEKAFLSCELQTKRVMEEKVPQLVRECADLRKNLESARDECEALRLQLREESNRPCDVCAQNETFIDVLQRKNAELESELSDIQAFSSEMKSAYDALATSQPTPQKQAPTPTPPPTPPTLSPPPRDTPELCPRCAELEVQVHRLTNDVRQAETRAASQQASLAASLSQHRTQEVQSAAEAGKRIQELQYAVEDLEVELANAQYAVEFQTSAKLLLEERLEEYAASHVVQLAAESNKVNQARDERASLLRKLWKTLEMSPPLDPSLLLDGDQAKAAEQQVVSKVVALYRAPQQQVAHQVFAAKESSVPESRGESPALRSAAAGCMMGNVSTVEVEGMLERLVATHRREVSRLSAENNRLAVELSKFKRRGEAASVGEESADDSRRLHTAARCFYKWSLQREVHRRLQVTEAANKTIHRLHDQQQKLKHIASVAMERTREVEQELSELRDHLEK